MSLTKLSSKEENKAVKLSAGITMSCLSVAERELINNGTTRLSYVYQCMWRLAVWQSMSHIQLLQFACCSCILPWGIILLNHKHSFTAFHSFLCHAGNFSFAFPYSYSIPKLVAHSTGNQPVPEQTQRSWCFFPSIVMLLLIPWWQDIGVLFL